MLPMAHVGSEHNASSLITSLYRSYLISKHSFKESLRKQARRNTRCLKVPSSFDT